MGQSRVEDPNVDALFCYLDFHESTAKDLVITELNLYDAGNFLF